MNLKKTLILVVVIFLIVLLFGAIKNLKNDSQSIKTGSVICGDEICSKNETKSNCPNDCDEITCREFYGTIESNCIKKGWEKLTIDVNGIEREILWDAPEIWSNGAIIALHGGEGTYVLMCGPVPKEQNRFLSDTFRGVPAVEFGELAVEQGFAVFSLNSAYNRATDMNGLPIGKRWDSLMQDKKNIDLDFIEKVIDETIPSLRPANSKSDIFMTGISNGGFMTVLASTHFNEKVTAFAPVASGDPYGMYFDMTKKQPLRKCGPGTWRDLETNKEIHHEESCKSDSYLNEKQWPTTTKNVPFKQFFHEGDGGIHISCMKKTRDLLVENEYKDAGAFIIDNPNGKRTLEKHFWHSEYNQPILDFFKEYSTN
jgi:hypothetical protein